VADTGDDGWYRGLKLPSGISCARQAEGSVPLHGYTLEEALLLFRAPHVRRAGTPMLSEH
jgi:hypothetical protein